MALIRGANPIWSEFNVTGSLFDDTYFLFILQNTLPYAPATVWQDPFGNVAWSNPIQFLANGTLPNNIYWDTTQLYRLEFRQGPTQAFPLIGNPIQNYSPGAGGSTPITNTASISDNEMTNPQFSLVSFASPYTITGGTTQNINVAPGWVLQLIGTGNLTLSQTPLNNSATTINPTNAPYALQINLSGAWTSAILVQQFQQNGMLWANQTVSSSITAAVIGAPQAISATLVDSNGTVLGTVLSSTNVTSTFMEYLGYATLPATTNPNLPPAAYIQYQLTLPNAVDILLTSFQLVVGAPAGVEPTFIEDTIDRQIDRTFHNYRNSLLFLPKSSILTGFNCSLNPWQYTTVSKTTLASKCAYTADQIIVYQQGGASQIATSQGTVGDNLPFNVTAVTATNQFAMIEYIDPMTISPYWGQNVSALIRAKLTTVNASSIQFKMRLISRATLPSNIGSTEPIASWTAGGDPVFASGWTAIIPQNDPVYTLTSAYQNFAFNQVLLPASTAATMTLGVVFYTISNMSTTTTADSIQIERASLVPNDFAIEASPLTWDENLSRCQYYWEQSYPLGYVPGAVIASNSIICNQYVSTSGGNDFLIPQTFSNSYNTYKRVLPALAFYPGVAGTFNYVQGYLYQAGVLATTAAISIVNWTSFDSDTKSFSYVPANATGFLETTSSTSTQAFIAFQFTANARLGG